MQDAPAEFVVITTRDQAEAAGAQIVALTLLRNQVLDKKNRADFAAQRLRGRADELCARMRRYEEALEVWAGKDRTTWGETKRLELRHVVLAFKLAPRAVRLLKGWTEELVIKAMQRRKTLVDYIRIKREINRQLIITDSGPDRGKLSAEKLKRVGIEVFQEEKFRIDPKLDDGAPAARLTSR